MKLPVKVVPGASSAGIAGWLGDVLKIRVTVPPEKGKANKAVEKLIAQALNLSADQVTIVSGQTSARKVIHINGLSEAEVRQVLSEKL